MSNWAHMQLYESEIRSKHNYLKEVLDEWYCLVIILVPAPLLAAVEVNLKDSALHCLRLLLYYGPV